mgnify:FL=1|jgi:hypothetical protein
MATEIEVSLRVPTLTLRAPGEPERRIDNSLVRFVRRVEVPALPKANEVLTLSAGQGQHVFEATVTRSDWHEEKALFVVSCAYAKRSLPPALYQALTSDTDWAAKTLI